MSRMRTSDKEASEPEIDHLPPAYDTLSIHGGVPSIPAIAIALAHHDEATPIANRISTVVTDVQEFEPPSRSLAHTLPRSRSNIDFATQVTKLPNDAVIPTVDVNKSFPELPQFNSRKTVATESASSSHRKRAKRNQARKAKSGSSSWLSFLPFISSKATKRDRQSVLALIHDLVIPPPTNSGNPNPKSPQSALADPHEILASCSKTCSAKNLSLSTLLQEPHIAGHTAIYWVIVNYNPSILDALLKYASPLTPTTLSEMRKACLVVSNQPLFQNLRHSVGLCASGLRTTDGLLLGQRPPDDVRIEEGPNGTFAATLDIAMWQKRIRAVGSVSVEFIASGHIFALTFFTADRPQPKSKSTKDKRVVGPLHVSLSLLEHSLPTYVDAAVVIDGPPPLPPPWPCPRPPRNSSSPRKHIHSASFSGKETGYGFENGVGLWGCETDSNYGEQARTRLLSPSSLSSSGYSRPATFSGANAQKQMLFPPPSHPHRGLIQTHSSPSLKQLSSSSSRSSHMLTSVLDSKVTALTPKKQLLKLKNASLGSSGCTPVVLRFSVGKSMLACRMKNGDPHGLPHPTTIKPDTWSEHGMRYVSAIVMPLGEQDGAGLMFDTSPHIASDGSLRARLEARLVKTEEGGKECIIC
ncbi:uncharacterized protein HD556DRAFT_65204 [Suillus plorans]|uniref:Uncharacterized protein n=1 Tax=Suillus plorans TaxID=116603 RepID=A0A9P7J265_9AGAM|nr:uncharacterized protein HD556DRAFT_65204 [Suillus plorans]KAG1799777.1 hypothetical protein HD556DRAFT_65204 [Suillus plorans]